MSKCISCKHLFGRDVCWFCDIKYQEIPHPCFWVVLKNVLVMSKILKKRESLSIHKRKFKEVLL